MENQMRAQQLRDQQAVMQTLQATNGDLGAALPQLAGKVSPQTYMGLAKAHFETKEAALKMSNEQLAHDKTVNDNLLGLMDQAKQLSPEQYAAQWPTIAAQAIKLKPELQGHIDPNQPIPQQSLAQFEIGLQTHSAIQAQVMKEREVTAQEKSAQARADMAAKQPVTEASLAAKAAAGDTQAEAALKRLDQSKREARPVTNIMTGNDAKDIADAIENGDQPPTLQGLYRNAGPVRAELARRGVPLAKMETDWKATQKIISTMNGPQQLRLRQAISVASDSLDKIDSLYQEYHSLVGDAGMKAFNKAGLAAAKQLPGRAGAVATALDAQIADVTAELGNVYMGGNSPTDHSLGLAAKNLSSDWNKQTFEEALKQARANIKIRQNSILHSQPVGVSGDNTYMPQQQSQESGGLSVTAPNGKTYTFKDQQSLNNFKKAAGIQ